MQPILGVLAQRIDHLLWRYYFTLAEIKETWAQKAHQDSSSLRALCEPMLQFRQPTLLDIAATPMVEERMMAIAEPAPDRVLYGILRAIDHAFHNPLPIEEGLRQELYRRAYDFLHDYLEGLVEGRREVEDSSNAWWAVRSGLHHGDARFRNLLDGVANKFNDVRIDLGSVSRLTTVPEIVQPLKTVSYTLSNIQAIFEIGVANDALRDRLHQIIVVMLSRLLGSPLNKHLYLASVHHEGLRNYLDYVKDQNLPPA
jgi:hypothetical protein